METEALCSFSIVISWFRQWLRGALTQAGAAEGQDADGEGSTLLATREQSSQVWRNITPWTSGSLSKERDFWGNTQWMQKCAAAVPGNRLSSVPVCYPKKVGQKRENSLEKTRLLYAAVWKLSPAPADFPHAEAVSQPVRALQGCHWEGRMASWELARDESVDIGTCCWKRISYAAYTLWK